MRNEDIGAKVAKRLRELREAQGLSLRALARRANVTAEMVSRAEKNAKTPSVQTLASLCEGLEMPLSEFFQFDVEPKRTKADAVALGDVDEGVRLLVLDGFRAISQGVRLAAKSAKSRSSESRHARTSGAPGRLGGKQ